MCIRDREGTPRPMGLPSLKIRFRTNLHPSLDCYGPIDDSDLLFFSESLTLMDPSVVFRASIVLFIRSFMIINIGLMGFSVFLLLVGWFVISGFFQTISRDVTLFVTGETAPFFVQLFHIFWGCGAGSSLGSAVSIS